MNIKTYVKRAFYLCVIVIPNFFYCAAPTPPTKQKNINLNTLSLKEIELKLDTERKNLDAFLQKKIHRPERLIDKAQQKSITLPSEYSNKDVLNIFNNKRNKLVEAEKQATQELATLHAKHPLKFLPDEKLKKLQELELTSDVPTEEADRRSLNLLKEQHHKELAIAQKKLAAQLELQDISPEICDLLLEKDRLNYRILTLEASYYKHKYQPLVTPKQLVQDEQEFKKIRSNDQSEKDLKDFNSHKGALLKDFYKYSGFNSSELKEHYNKRYTLCSIALEHNKITNTFAQLEKNYWQKKYENAIEQSLLKTTEGKTERIQHN